MIGMAVSYTHLDVYKRQLQKFVNSFDWLHSDEKTRLLYVHNRIANGEGGFNQNHYGSPEEAKDFPVLEGGVGVCRDFAEEFQFLCRIVGLECVTYTPEYLHDACLVRIGTQWYATDPTSSCLLYTSTAAAEAEEWAEAYKEGKKMTTSCCPAFVNMIKQHFPQLLDNMSTTVSPMCAVSRMLKAQDPEVVTVFILSLIHI